MKKETLITEDYVSFETAKLLKEKGFPLPSTNFEDWAFCMYDENGKIQWGCYHPYWYARVTLQMAMKWLRKVHRITIGITFSLNIITYEIQKDEEVITAISSSRTYENMVEEAIVLCLKTLI